MTLWKDKSINQNQTNLKKVKILKFNKEKVLISLLIALYYFFNNSTLKEVFSRYQTWNKDSEVCTGCHFTLINDTIHSKDMSHKDLCPKYHYIKMYKSKTTR